MRTFEYMMELFLVHRKQIRHRDPQVAVAFALMTLSSTLIELILVDHATGRNLNFPGRKPANG